LNHVNKLFARQLAKATNASGEIDLDVLGSLVIAAYEQSDRDRRRTDRSISLMIEELDQLNRSLGQQVADRTVTLREREAQLQAQNMRFDAALNNMSHGLVMFDSSARMVICSQPYMEMYDLPADLIKPGITVSELLRYRMKTGTFAGDPDSYTENLLASIAKGQAVSNIVELPDGRTIFVLNHPIADGGWVATHEDITDRRRAENKIAHMARHDSLTDLPNRVLFQERLSEALLDVHRGNRLAVLYLDLDHFKGVNDTLGHLIGDELLKVVAGRLRHCIRDNDTVARVGGDEFAIIQAGADNPRDTAALATRICHSLSQPYDLTGHAVVVDVSIGIAIAPSDGTEPVELIKNADMALYGAKADGRGTYRFFEPAMDARMKARRELEMTLRTALSEGQFELQYQPLLNLHDNRISCCEALVRWKHPERGMIPPAEFIPAAEEIGLIVQLGEWVLRKACADAASWPDGIKVAVNLSPIQVMSANLMPVVIGALASAGLPANRLELEITESVLMQNTEATLAALHRLRELGVKISMDDFGTGYSSLSYLRRFPFDKLKIDRCFISGLSEGDDSFAIVRAVTSMARSLGMITTAEGVETKQQLQQVRTLGCTEVQGFLISRPKNLADITRLIRSYSEKQAKTA
jgi:diguanylate cyclase (GGDEF)-like protein